MKRALSIVVILAMGLLIVPSWSVGAQREDVKRLLKRLEENTDRFRKSLDDALDHSTLNGTQAEDEINKYVHDFEEATDHLKDRYEDHGAAPNLTREVLLRGQAINRFMRTHRLGARAETDWQIVRGDLNTLARIYNIRWRW